MLSIAEVLLPAPLDQLFSYQVAADMLDCQPGQLVLVQFRARQIIGVVSKISSASSYPKPLKPLLKLLPWHLRPELTTFIEKVAHYTISPKGSVLKMCLAPNSFYQSTKTPSTIHHHHTPLNITLNDAQEAASKHLISTIGQKKVILLEGVTGSGKTEVYNKLVHELLLRNKQTLILMPEILLATHITQRLSERFGFPAIEWHSNLTSKQRRENYHYIITGQAKLIIAARSGLFLPFPSLGAIIVDEEHDTSYKQEDGVIYSARDMAVLRGHTEGCPVVLCSATPSIETIHNVRSGRYEHIYLANRFGTAVMPEIKIIDMNKEKLPKGKFISPTLLSAMQDSIASGNQALLYLNRRGYAPLTICGACGHKVECPNCSALLVEHRHKRLLQCHYCGHTAPSITKCSNCGAEDKTTTYGPGVEKIAEELLEALPEANIAMFTSDHITNRKDAETMMSDIIERRTNIIIGTQMIAKGLHFPKLQFVGIIDADAGMIGGDIRAIERTYQVLQQVSGRAGRDKESGLVMLQTYEPDGIMIKHILAEDTAKFIDSELHDRELSFSPPFSRLIMVHLSAANELHLIQCVDMMARLAPYSEKIQVIGPAPAPIYMIGKRYRYRFIVKSAKNINTNKVVQTWIDQTRLPPTVKVKVDVDPYSFL